MQYDATIISDDDEYAYELCRWLCGFPDARGHISRVIGPALVWC